MSTLLFKNNLDGTTDVVSGGINTLKINADKTLATASPSNTMSGNNLATVGQIPSLVVTSISGLLTADTTKVVNVLNYHTGLEGGGGVFYWDASKPKTEHNGGTVIDPAKVFPTNWNNQTQLTTWFTAGSSGTGCWVRQYDGAVNVKWFGAKASNSVTNNYMSIKQSLLFNNVTVDGDFYLTVNNASGSLTTLESAVINGHNGRLIVANYDSLGTLTIVLALSNGAEVNGLSIEPFNTNFDFVDNTDYTVVDNDLMASFSANDNLIAIGCGNNTKVHGVHIERVWRGISSSGVKNITVTDCSIYQTSNWMTQFYDSQEIVFSNNTCRYGGGSGGVAFSSSKKITVTGNYVKGVGTGINTGGSASVGFNVEDVVITGNTVFARDCINLENGATNYTISGNQCVVIKNHSLTGLNGVGISNSSDSSGFFSGMVSKGTISSNSISAYVSEYAKGINFGSVEAVIGSDFNGVVISNNYIEGAVVGIICNHGDSDYTIKDLLISNNVIYSSDGMQINNTYGAIITSNQLINNNSTVIDSYDGILLADYVEASVTSNKLSGFHTAFYLASPNKASGVTIKQNDILPHRISGASTVFTVDTDGDFAGSAYFIDKPVTITDTTNRLTLRGAFTLYSPASPITTNGLSGFSCFKGGETITVQFNGNVTLQQNAPYTYLQGGAATNPPAGKHITFIAHWDNRLTEISRDY